MFGENAELEYGGDLKNIDVPYNPFEDWDKYYFKNTSFQKVLKFGFENGYLTESDLKEPCLSWYTLPPIEEIKK